MPAFRVIYCILGDLGYRGGVLMALLAITAFDSITLVGAYRGVSPLLLTQRLSIIVMSPTFQRSSQSSTLLPVGS